MQNDSKKCSGKTQGRKKCFARFPSSATCVRGQREITRQSQTASRGWRSFCVFLQRSQLSVINTRRACMTEATSAAKSCTIIACFLCSSSAMAGRWTRSEKQSSKRNLPLKMRQSSKACVKTDARRLSRLFTDILIKTIMFVAGGGGGTPVNHIMWPTVASWWTVKGFDFVTAGEQQGGITSFDRFVGS